MTAVERLIATAKAEIGYLEKATNAYLDDKTANAGSNNWTKYARDLDLLGVYNGKKNGYAWCDMFVDWCFVTTFGLQTAWAMTFQAYKGAGAGCTYSAMYFKNKGRFGKTPQIGAQIFFTNDGGKTSCHTGLVTGFDANYVYTIEGNTGSAAGIVANGGCVRAKQYSRNYAGIYGYGYPDFSMVPGEIAPAPVTSPKYPEIDGANVEATIWNFLIKAGYNPYGVAGLMGNLFSESGLSPINLENFYEKKLGHTDKSYTEAVDKGTYGNFVNDAAGYGLAQWTYYTRKQALLNYAKSKGTSIGNLTMQLEFLVQELKTSFSAVDKVLRNAISVKEASDTVMLKFENPANKSAEALAKRAAVGEGYFAKYVKKEDNIMMTDEQLTQWFLRFRKTLQDNDSSNYSADARKWAADSGLMKGSGTLPNGEPNMMWEDFITREQFMTVLYRYHTESIAPLTEKICAIAAKLGV